MGKKDIVVFLLFFGFIALAVGGGALVVHNYTANGYDIAKAVSWLNNAENVYDLNVSAQDIHIALGYLQNLHGNPVYIYPMSGTSWSALRLQLNGEISEAQYLASHQNTSTNGFTYQTAYEQYRSTLQNIITQLQYDISWVVLSPLVAIISLMFFITGFVLFGVISMFYNDSDGLYLFGIFMIVYISMLIYYAAGA